MRDEPRRKHRLRLLGSEEPERPPVLGYENRLGVMYYLHGGRTKTGKQRYFVRKTIAPGALPSMPSGYEFTESLNGVVSVRRVRAGTATDVPEADLVRVRDELGRHDHLRHHRAEARGSDIVIHEPMDPFIGQDLEKIARALFLDASVLEPRTRGREPRRYQPVMKLSRETKDQYSAHRMTYRGDGGWHLFAFGSLAKVLQNVRHIGTDAFFELL